LLTLVNTFIKRTPFCRIIVCIPISIRWRKYFYLCLKSLKFSTSNGTFRFSGTVTNGNAVTSRLFGTVSISCTSYTSLNLRLCSFSNSLINFVERDSHSVSPNSVFISDSAGNNHIDFGTQRQFQDTFHFSTIKTFHRTGVITFIGHC